MEFRGQFQLCRDLCECGKTLDECNVAKVALSGCNVASVALTDTYSSVLKLCKCCAIYCIGYLKILKQTSAPPRLYADVPLLFTWRHPGIGLS